MSGAPLLDEIRVAMEAGLGALEKQLAALGERTTAGLKPGERCYVRWVIDNLAWRIVAWHEIVGPDLLARAVSLAEQVQALQARRRGCVRGRGPCVGSRGPHRTEEY